MLNVAPWQPFADVVPIDAAPSRCTSDEPGGTEMPRPVWSVKDTPVVVHDGWLPSVVIGPLPVTVMSVIPKLFGLLTRRITSAAAPPGISREFGASPPATPRRSPSEGCSRLRHSIRCRS